MISQLPTIALRSSAIFVRPTVRLLSPSVLHSKSRMSLVNLPFILLVVLCLQLYLQVHGFDADQAVFNNGQGTIGQSVRDG